MPVRLLLSGSLLLAPGVAWCDVVLDGHQHIGDNESVTFTPSDPVERSEFASNPTRFHLTQALQITGLRLETFVSANPAPLVGQQIRITFGGQPVRTVPQNGGVLTFSPAINLNPGFRTIAIDPGCLRSGVQSFNCRGSDDEFDIGFSAITLLAAGTSLSINLAQRRHIGDTFDYRGNNNFSDAFYPDGFEAASVDLDFDLAPLGLRLYQIDFSRLRDGARAGQFLSRGRAAVFTRTFSTQVCDFGPINFERNVNLLSLQQGNCFLPAGGYFLRVTAGQMKSTTSELDKGLDDISWKDIILLLAPDVSGVPGRFNAIASDQLDVVAGVIRTQIAGVALGRGSSDPLGIDAVALDNGLLFSSYSGTANVELLDASNDIGTLDASGCLSSWLPNRVYLGQITFASVDGGRKTLLGSMEVANAYSKARLLLTDTQNPQSYGCSTDAFAVRPNTFALTVTDQDWENADPAGTGRPLNNLDAVVATPVHKAGRPFTIRATALNADEGVTTGYVGTPTVVAAETILGANVGDVSGGVWAASGGVAQTDTARYNEVGAVRLEIRDTTFAAVDAADTDSTHRQISPATIAAGRFVPDHFNVSVNTPEFEHGCGSFTYMGQPFKYRPGFEPQTTLTAVAFGAPPTATRNYTGDLYKLPKLPDNFLPGVSAYTAFGQALDTSAVPVPDNSVSELGDGVVLLTFTGTGMVFPRPNAPVVPFDADIQFTRTIVDSDGITTEPTPVQFGLASGGNGIAFNGGAKQVRFGRLVLDNAYGSERLPLDVPLRTEYWAGSGGGSGFVHNVQDNCTSLPQANAVLSGGISASTSVSATTPLTGGKGAIRLAKPEITGQVTITADLSALLYPWLWIDGDGNNNYNEAASADPSSQANFGVFKNNERRIYQREMVR